METASAKMTNITLIHMGCVSVKSALLDKPLALDGSDLLTFGQWVAQVAL